MPFCIIFFTITVIFIFCFKFNNINRILGVLGLILALFCLFVPEVDVDSKIYINWVFVAFLSLVVVWFSLINSFRTNICAFIISIVIGFSYFVALQLDLFLSIDYSIIFGLALGALPVILSSANIKKGLLVATNISIAIFIYDTIFWYKELQYIEFNEINVMNLMASFYIIGIVVGCIRAKLAKKRVLGEKYGTGV